MEGFFRGDQEEVPSIEEFGGHKTEVEERREKREG